MITYNNKNVLKSYIGDKQIVKKIINGTVVYGSPDFASYYQIDRFNNYKVIGSITNTNGVITGLSNGTNYLQIDYQLPQIINSFEMVVRCDTGTTGRGCYTYSYPEGYYTYGAFAAQAVIKSATSAKTYWRYKAQETSSETEHILKAEDGTSLATTTNQLVYNKLTMETISENDYLYSIYQSLDGENWTLLVSQHDTYQMTGNDFGPITFVYNKNYGTQSQGYTTRSIDLNNTHIKVNGKMWFNGNPNYGELVWCNPNVYLQSTGTQYIDTEILPNSNLEFDVKFLTSNTIGASGYGCIFGGRYNSGNNDLQVTTFRNNQANTSGTFRFGLNTTDASQSAGITLNVATEAHFHNLTYSTNTTNYIVPTYNFTNPRKIFLFGLNGNGTMMQSGKGCKIYYAKFNKSTQRSYFVPVPEGLQIGSYKVPSNGMFDIVTQTFFENKGSGEFIWGVDL